MNYKLTAWVREDGTPVRYIREAETVAELWELLLADVDLENVLEVHIYHSK